MFTNNTFYARSVMKRANLFIAFLLFATGFTCSSIAVTHDDSENVYVQFLVQFRGQPGIPSSLTVKFTAYDEWDPQPMSWVDYIEQYTAPSLVNAGWRSFTILVAKGMPLDRVGNLEISGANVAEYKVYIDVQDTKYVARTFVQESPTGHSAAERRMIHKDLAGGALPLPHTHYIFFNRSGETGELAGKASSVMAGWRNFKISLGYGKTGKPLGYINFWKGNQPLIADATFETKIETYSVTVGQNQVAHSLVRTPQMTFDMVWDNSYQESGFAPGAFIINGYDNATQESLRVNSGGHLVFPPTVEPVLRYVLNYSGPDPNTARTKVQRTERSAGTPLIQNGLTMISEAYRQHDQNSGSIQLQHCTPVCYNVPVTFSGVGPSPGFVQIFPVCHDYCWIERKEYANGVTQNNLFDWVESGYTQPRNAKASVTTFSFYAGNPDPSIPSRLIQTQTGLGTPGSFALSSICSQRKESSPSATGIALGDSFFWGETFVHPGSFGGAWYSGSKRVYNQGGGGFLKLSHTHHTHSHDGPETKYEYQDEFDSFGLVKKVRRPLGDIAPSLSAGLVTEYTYASDWDGSKTLPEQIVTKTAAAIPGDQKVTSLTKFEYLAGVDQEGQAIKITKKHAYYGPGANDKLTTITRQYRADAQRSFAHLPVSEELPDGTKTIWFYEAGPWDEANLKLASINSQPAQILHNPQTYEDSAVQVWRFSCFSASIPGALQLAVHEGTYGLTYVVPNKSTAELRVRDKWGRLRSVETFVCVGVAGQPWAPLGKEIYDYDLSGNLSKTRKLIGGTYLVSYEASYHGGRKVSETDETGLVKHYSYDAHGRVISATETASSGIVGIATPPATRTEYVYDPENRVVSKKVISPTFPTFPIVTGIAYDTAGRLNVEADADGYATSHFRSIDFYQRNEGGLNDPTFDRLFDTTMWDDGTVKSISGNGGLPSYQNLEVANIGGQTMTLNGTTVKVGTLRQIQSVGDATGHTSRGVTNDFDWLGRPVRTTSGNPALVGTTESINTYNGKGQLVRSETPGLASTVSEYDNSGQLFRSGMKLSGGNPLELSTTSDYRISEQTTGFELSDGYWWEKTVNKTYNVAGSATPITINTTWKLRSGFTLATFEMPQHGPLTVLLDSWTVNLDVSGNTTTTARWINREKSFVLVQISSSEFQNPDNSGYLNGKLVYHISPTGEREDYIYDDYGRLVSTLTRAGTSQTVYKPGTFQVRSQKAPDNSWVSFEYDPAGRLKHQRVFTAESPVEPAMAAAGLSTRYEYNSRNQLTRTWGDVPHPIENVYADGSQSGYLIGELYEQRTFNGGTAWNGATWPASPGPANTTRFTYYPENGLLKEKKLLKTAPSTWQTVSYEYNKRRQLTKRTWHRGVVTTYLYKETAGQNTGELDTINYTDDPDISFTYNRLGAIASVTDAAGTRTYHYRPGDGQQDYQELPSATYGPNLRITQTYDSIGRRNGYWLGSSMSAPDAQSSYEFSEIDGRVKRINSPLGSFTYSYLPNSSLISRIDGPYCAGSYPLAHVRGYAANSDLLMDWSTTMGNTQLASYSHRYDSLNRLEKTSQIGKLYQAYGPGLSLQFGYNNRGELTGSTTYLTDQPDSIDGNTPKLPRRQLAFAYDTAGNRLTTQTDADAALSYVPHILGHYSSRAQPGFVEANGLVHKNTVTIDAYLVPNGIPVGFSPPLSRLVLGQTDYDYFHGKGNRATPSSAGREFVRLDTTLAGSPAISQTRHVFAAPTSESFTYDDDGNMTANSIFSFTYDAENRVKEIKVHQSLFPRIKVVFSYDFLGRRIKKQFYGTWNSFNDTWSLHDTYVYAYDGWNLISEHRFNELTFGLSKTYSYWGLDLSGTIGGAGGIGGLLGLVSAGSQENKYLAFSDLHGNVLGLIDQSVGLIAAEYEYSPFGELLRSTGPMAAVNPWQYSTKYYDRETDLLNFGYRYYSPSLGRFINRDPKDEPGFAMLSAPLGGGGASVWSHSLAPPELVPDTSLAKASLPHSNDRVGSFKNSTQHGNTVANRKGAGRIPSGGGSSASRGAVAPSAGGEHLYAFVGNNPMGAIDPLGLDFDEGLYAQHVRFQNYQRTGQMDMLAYWDSTQSLFNNPIYDFSRPSDVIDFLHFQYNHDSQEAIANRQSALWGMVLGPVKSGLEFITGRDLWTDQFVDRESSFQSLALETIGFGLSFRAGAGFARSALSTTIERSSFMPTFGPRSLWSDFAAKSGVWELGAAARGTAVENLLAARDYKGWFRVGQLDKGTFPLIDFQMGNNLVSLKTVDTTGSTWLGRMQEHIDDLATRGATVDGNPANMILDIRVQPGGASAAQQLIGYGQREGVTVIVKEFP